MSREFTLPPPSRGALVRVPQYRSTWAVRLSMAPQIVIVLSSPRF